MNFSRFSNRKNLSALSVDDKISFHGLPAFVKEISPEGEYVWVTLEFTDKVNGRVRGRLKSSTKVTLCDK